MKSIENFITTYKYLKVVDNARYRSVASPQLAYVRKYICVCVGARNNFYPPKDLAKPAKSNIQTPEHVMPDRHDYC